MLALAHLADLEALGHLDRVGQVLLAPVNALREQWIAGQGELRVALELAAALELGPERVVGAVE